MVAWHATFLRADQRLIKGKEHFIQFKDIIIPVDQEIFNDNIKFTAMR